MKNLKGCIFSRTEGGKSGAIFQFGKGNFVKVLFKESIWLCCRKGDPFQGPKVGSYLTLRNELSELTHMLTKQGTLLGRDTCQRAVGSQNPGELLCQFLEV